MQMVILLAELCPMRKLTRAELRAITPRNVEFKEFTKLVGKNWQAQDPVEKEQREAAAQKLKDEYNKRNSEYKKTPNYAKYQEILAAWKLKHPNGQAATHGEQVAPYRTDHCADHADAKRQCVGLGNVDPMRDNSIERDDDYSLNSNEDENHSPSSPPMAPNTYDSSMTSTMATRWRAGGLQPAGGFASPPPRSSFSGYDQPDDYVPHRSSGHHEDRNLVTSGYLAHGSLSDSDRTYSRRSNPQGSLNVGGFRALAPEPAVPSLGGETTLPPRSVRRPDDRSSADRAFSGPQSVPRYERHSSPKSVPDRLLPAPAELLRSVSVEERSRWSDRSRERYPSPHQPAHPSDPSRGVYYSSPRSTRRSPPHLNDAAQAQRHFEAGGRQSPAPQDRAPLISRTRNDQPPGSPPAPTASPSKSDRLRPILDGQSWASREDTAEPDRRAKNPDLMTLLRPSENDREAARPSLQPQMALGRTT